MFENKTKITQALLRRNACFGFKKVERQTLIESDRKRDFTFPPRVTKINLTSLSQKNIFQEAFIQNGN
ncbi:MAG: hypothetical protein ACR2N3_15730 [Pyrinomonadaceae bacterium]